MSIPSLPPTEPITATQLAYYLFGNPLDPKDLGVIGRLEARVDRLTKLWVALLFAILAAVLALIGNLIVLATGVHYHP